MVVAETSPLLQGKEQLMPKDNRARRSPFPQCLGHFHWQIFYAKGLKLNNSFFLC